MRRRRGCGSGCRRLRRRWGRRRRRISGSWCRRWSRSLSWGRSRPRTLASRSRGRCGILRDRLGRHRGESDRHGHGADGKSEYLVHWLFPSGSGIGEQGGRESISRVAPARDDVAAPTGFVVRRPGIPDTRDSSHVAVFRAPIRPLRLDRLSRWAPNPSEL
jgi:hypothetical protein